MKNLLTTISLILVMVSVSSAQVDKVGKFALGIDGVNSPNLAFKYFVSNNAALELIAGLNIYSPGGDAPTGTTKVTGSDIRAGLAFLYHFNTGDFTPYIGVDGIFKTNTAGGFFAVEDDAKNSIDAGLIVGGEYFLAKQFSIGIKERLGFDFQLSRDIPKEETDLLINTSTIVTARYYFN